jgi:hypothetical protein
MWGEYSRRLLRCSVVVLRAFWCLGSACNIICGDDDDDDDCAVN